jgi:hypothetical protein
VRQDIGVLVHVLNFDVAQKNVGAQEHALNLVLRSVHTHNNYACGVHSVGSTQRIFVDARAMWVYVVTRQFS